MNFFFGDCDELKLAKAVSFCFLELSEIILYDSTSCFIFIFKIEVIFESSKISQFIYSINLIAISLDNV